MHIAKGIGWQPEKITIGVIQTSNQIPTCESCSSNEKLCSSAKFPVLFSTNCSITGIKKWTHHLLYIVLLCREELTAVIFVAHIKKKLNYTEITFSSSSGEKKLRIPNDEKIKNGTAL